LKACLGYKSGGTGSIPGSTRKKKVVGLERGPLSLVSTIEELFDRKVAAPAYKSENTALGIRHADHVAHSNPQKLAITSSTSGGRSVGIVRSWTQTMEFSLVELKTHCNIRYIASWGIFIAPDLLKLDHRLLNFYINLLLIELLIKRRHNTCT
jgi:hypothetical protein